MCTCASSEQEHDHLPHQAMVQNRQGSSGSTPSPHPNSQEPHQTLAVPTPHPHHISTCHTARVAGWATVLGPQPRRRRMAGPRLSGPKLTRNQELPERRSSLTQELTSRAEGCR